MENCGTCSLTDMKCPGHLGHIELPVPVYHPLWMRQLELVCIICNYPNGAGPMHFIAFCGRVTVSQTFICYSLKPNQNQKCLTEILKSFS